MISKKWFFYLVILILPLLSGCGAALVSSAGGVAGGGSAASAAVSSGSVLGAVGVIYGAYAIGKMVQEHERAKEYLSVHSHMSTSLHKSRTEPQGFGLYSYVLMGERAKNIENPCDTPDVKACKYYLVLNEVQENGNYKRRSSFDGVAGVDFGNNKQGYNLFLLPSEGMVLDVSLSNYNYDLAFAYLEAINFATGGKFDLLKKEGPFIISLRSPIAFDEKNAYATYVDLSNVKPELVEQIVSTYKRKLQSANGNQPFSSFDVMKADFIKSLVDLDDDINMFLQPLN